MAFKKIDKQFVLSDSSINVYGFRLLTSGCDLDESLKNPIGYYNHDHAGILVKWEDVVVLGDQIVGTPCINLEHPRGERTVTEIEEGFLNAASVGHICLIDTVLEDNPNNPEEPTLVGTKWYYKECSMVDSPGNRNAFKLYDHQDKEINLADVRQAHVDNNIVLNQKLHMSKIALTITPLLVSLLSLADNADQGAFEAAIQDLADKKTAAETTLADELKKYSKEKVEAIIAKGLSDGRFNKATGDKLAKTYEGKPTELADLVKDMLPYKPLTNMLVDNDLPKELADKTYDELDKANKMEIVKRDHPELYRKVFKEKFNKEPKI